MMYTVPYPTGDSRYEQINFTLEDYTSPDSSLSHASFGFEHGMSDAWTATEVH
jgi:hypothetical protein